MLFVNFKTYPQGTGVKALMLVKILEEVSHESQVKIIPVLQATDIKEAALATTLEIWSQHVDPVEPGAHTGFILPEAVLEDGAMGTFLNHSEHKFSSIDQLKKANERALAVGLKTLIFADGIDEIKKVVNLRPSFVSYEPPELVGSTDASVSSSYPDIIKEASDICFGFGIPLIVGAGIHSMEDVKRSLELGAVGVAVSSDIVKSQDPKKEVLNLVEGFN
jgi:triosephosphate isomerase